MPARNKGALDEPTLAHIATHAVRNSKDLLNEAEVLSRAGRWARAAALAVLSVEESGKAHLCHVWAFHVLPAVDDPKDDRLWQPFWDAFVDHPGKIDLWVSKVDGVGGCGDFGAWIDLAKNAHLNKLSCLYVDFVVPERAVTAPEYITESDAQQMMDLAQEASDFWDSHGWGVDTR